MIGAIKQTPFETVTIEKTASRQTPKPQSGAFAKVLKQGAMALLGAAGGVASALPCGGIVSAAVDGLKAADTVVRRYARSA